MTPGAENQLRFHRAELRDWTGRMLVQAGVDAEDAELAAEGLVRADARGFKTHGLARLPNYLEKFTSGALTAGVEPFIQRNGAFIRYDARNTLGQICGPRAVGATINLARQQPVAVCQLVNAGHLGALGINLLPAAEAGMVALMFQATPPIIGIPGAQAPLIGNNPLAMAAPRENGPPIVVDFACCMAARGNILLAARDGTPIPEGWALDRQGRGTTDPDEALLGALLPFGGHKGIALAMIVEILAGSLAGGEFQSSLNQGKSVKSGVGGLSALILIFNPAAMQGRTSYAAHVEAWTTHYQTQGGGAARIPGHRAHQEELQANQRGVVLLQTIVSELIEIGQIAGLPFPEPVSQS